MTIIDFLNNSSVLLIASFTPVILAAVELAKKWISNERYYPIIAILTGVILSWFFSGIVETAYRILLGVLAGFSAAGLYSGTKTVIK